MAADPNLTTSAGSLHPEPGFSFRRAFSRHWRDSVRHYGLWPTVRQLTQALYRLLREFLPGRRKEKFGDLDYDWERGMDTTRSNVSFRTQLAAALTGNQYFPSEPWIFAEIMHALPTNVNEFTFTDLGAGKGRALLLAAEHGYRRVIGIEFLPELHLVAQENIARLLSERPNAGDIDSICLDARDFSFPAGPLVIYLFNPFPEDVFAGVLENLKRSVETEPRPVWVAYRFPEFEELLQKSEWLQRVAGTEQWTVYKSIG
jgi:hypothetical protein